MEHSEEYYKMKYFKYKAKYTKEKQRIEQSAGLFSTNEKKKEKMKEIFDFYMYNINIISALTKKPGYTEEAIQDIVSKIYKATSKRDVEKYKTDLDLLFEKTNSVKEARKKEIEIWNKFTTYSKIKEKMDFLKDQMIQIKSQIIYNITDRNGSNLIMREFSSLCKNLIGDGINSVCKIELIPEIKK